MSHENMPAFPVPERHLSCGMSLRDYFAVHAPDAPDDFGWADGETDSWQRRTRWSFHYADAMLRAREN